METHFPSLRLGTAYRYEVLPPQDAAPIRCAAWHTATDQVYLTIDGSPRRSRQTRVRKWEVNHLGEEQLLGESTAAEFLDFGDVPETLARTA